MKFLPFITIGMAAVLSLSIPGCGSGPREKKIEFVYLALGASDATGVGATPLTEGYVFLVKRELDRRMPGVFLINLGVPGARIDLDQGTGARREAAWHQGESRHDMDRGERSRAWG